MSHIEDLELEIEDLELEIDGLRGDLAKRNAEIDRLKVLVKAGREAVSGCLIAMTCPECEAWLDEVEDALAGKEGK